MKAPVNVAPMRGVAGTVAEEVGRGTAETATPMLITNKAQSTAIHTLFVAIFLLVSVLVWEEKRRGRRWSFSAFYLAEDKARDKDAG